MNFGNFPVRPSPNGGRWPAGPDGGTSAAGGWVGPRWAGCSARPPATEHTQKAPACAGAWMGLWVCPLEALLTARSSTGRGGCSKRRQPRACRLRPGQRRPWARRWRPAPCAGRPARSAGPPTAGGVNGVGDQLLHGLAAADHGHARAVDHAGQVAAVGADEELQLFHGILSFCIYGFAGRGARPVVRGLRGGGVPSPDGPSIPDFAPQVCDHITLGRCAGFSGAPAAGNAGPLSRCRPRPRWR